MSFAESLPKTKPKTKPKTVVKVYTFPTRSRSSNKTGPYYVNRLHRWTKAPKSLNPLPETVGNIFSRMFQAHSRWEQRLTEGKNFNKKIGYFRKMERMKVDTLGGVDISDATYIPSQEWIKARDLEETYEAEIKKIREEGGNLCSANKLDRLLEKAQYPPKCDAIEFEVQTVEGRSKYDPHTMTSEGESESEAEEDDSQSEREGAEDKDGTESDSQSAEVDIGQPLAKEKSKRNPEFIVEEDEESESHESDYRETEKEDGYEYARNDTDADKTNPRIENDQNSAEISINSLLCQLNRNLQEFNNSFQEVNSNLQEFNANFKSQLNHPSKSLKKPVTQRKPIAVPVKRDSSATFASLPSKDRNKTHQSLRMPPPNPVATNDSELQNSESEFESLQPKIPSASPNKKEKSKKTTGKSIKNNSEIEPESHQTEPSSAPNNKNGQPKKETGQAVENNTINSNPEVGNHNSSGDDDSDTPLIPPKQAKVPKVAQAAKPPTKSQAPPIPPKPAAPKPRTKSVVASAPVQETPTPIVRKSKVIKPKTKRTARKAKVTPSYSDDNDMNVPSAFQTRVGLRNGQDEEEGQYEDEKNDFDENEDE